MNDKISIVNRIVGLWWSVPSLWQSGVRPTRRHSVRGLASGSVATNLRSAVDKFDTLLGAVVGGIASLVVNYCVWKRQKCREYTVKLYDEFHSRDMLQARSAASKMMKAAPAGVTMADLRASPDYPSLSAILHYFERVQVLAEEGMVGRRLLRRLLGRYARLWFGSEGGLARFLPRRSPVTGTIDPLEITCGAEWDGLRDALARLAVWLSPEHATGILKADRV